MANLSWIVFPAVSAGRGQHTDVVNGQKATQPLGKVYLRELCACAGQGYLWLVG
jgi:hypothetical protein